MNLFLLDHQALMGSRKDFTEPLAQVHNYITHLPEAGFSVTDMGHGSQPEADVGTSSGSIHTYTPKKVIQSM